MADLSDVLQGLTILNAYKGDNEEWNVDARHDEIYSQGPAPEGLAGAHAAKLHELGWHWDQVHESWRKFT